jgi:hypothetical protein
MAGAQTVNVPLSIPATVQIKRGRLFGLVVGIAALTAAVTWALTAYAFDNGNSTTTAATAPAIQGYMSYLGPHPAAATDTPPVISGPYPVSGGTGFVQTVTWPESTRATLGSRNMSYYPAQRASVDTPRDPSIMSLAPAGLAANALGTGYAVPSAQKGPSVESVLASMSPQTREYTKRIMNLTFAQLGAGAAGSP